MTDKKVYALYIKKENYKKLKEAAENDKRSISQMLDILLDKLFNKKTN